MFINTNNSNRKTTLIKDNITKLENIVKGSVLTQFVYQVFSLLVLGLLYKNNIYILNTIKLYNTTNKYLPLSHHIIYYKAFLFSFILITTTVNYIVFTKSIMNTESIKYLLLFLILQLFIVVIIFNNIDKHILALEQFTNTKSENIESVNIESVNDNESEDSEYHHNNHIDLPLQSELLKHITDYKDTELPDYVKNHPDKDIRINKPEHYDFAPDDIPHWHLDKDLSQKFAKLKKDWETDPNRNYRESVKAFDKYKVPQMDGGFKITHPEKYSKMFNLFEMNKEHNKPNHIIIQALESGGYDGKYIHNTAHLRRHNNTDLEKMQRYNVTGEYYDPNTVYQSLKYFPNPNIESIAICKNNLTNSNNSTKQVLDLESQKRNMVRADLQDDYEPSTYNPNNIYKTITEKTKRNSNSNSISNTNSINKYDNINTDNLSMDSIINYFENVNNKAGMEYLYSSDEINSQVLNKTSGLSKCNTKSKNILQYCTNYKPANNEQLRMVNDNTAYGIFDGK
jgi:hypothetical protein